MSVLDEVAAKAKSVVGDKVPAAGIAGALLEFLRKPEVGGMQGLVQTFEKAGLGAQIQSWIGKGRPLPISPDEVTRALGSGAIGDLAARAGMPAADATHQIATLLPDVVRQFASADGPAAGALGSVGAFVKSGLGK